MGRKGFERGASSGVSGTGICIVYLGRVGGVDIGRDSAEDGQGGGSLGSKKDCSRSHVLAGVEVVEVVEAVMT